MSDAAHWMGEVPINFRVQRLKALLREVDERTMTGREPLLSLRMREGLVRSAQYKRAPEEPTALIGYKIAHPGDLVMNRMRASIGLFGVADELGLVSPDYAVFKPRQGACIPYLLHLLKSSRAGSVIRSESRGMGTGSSGFLRIYTDRFGTICVALPSFEEQCERAKRADGAAVGLDSALSAVEGEIALLREYRTRLIADVVTGKKDVRQQAQNLPDVDPEALKTTLIGILREDIDEEIEDGD